MDPERSMTMIAGMRATWLVAICLCMALAVHAQDALQIYFLYGSKPARAHRDTEPHWFGGQLGGHVGIGFAADSVLNFVPSGRFHRVGRRDPKHSRYVVTDTADFWAILGGSQGALKTARITIPIDSAQRQQFEAIRQRYQQQTPYDYAFLGIRCASATDEILAKLGITKKRSYWGTIFSTFHPKRLRMRLLRMAKDQDWKVVRTRGSRLRVWQR